MRLKFCPHCGADISGTYEPVDPEVGITVSSWHCGACDETVVDEEEDEPDD